MLIEPAMTLPPGCLVTGMDSPVTRDSSIDMRPSTISPSTGALSPGRTRSRSATRTRSSVTSSSVPSSRRRRAVLGAKLSRALIAPLVRSRTHSSRTCPRSTSTVITAAASKQTGTAPAASRKAGDARPYAQWRLGETPSRGICRNGRDGDLIQAKPSQARPFNRLDPHPRPATRRSLCSGRSPWRQLAAPHSDDENRREAAPRRPEVGGLSLVDAGGHQKR